MPNNIMVAFSPLESNGGRKPVMVAKLLLQSLLIICVTFLLFTWITKGSLCELVIKQGGRVVVASLAYESRR
ncbi:Hok/Gef family protein [Pantoea sp. B65]|uniref:Hok/Gef family protein n=1 Tax=Pantoea sp. B65 TaxID=2813359 RepID=UPI0039B517C0